MASQATSKFRGPLPSIAALIVCVGAVVYTALSTVAVYPPGAGSLPLGEIIIVPLTACILARTSWPKFVLFFYGVFGTVLYELMFLADTGTRFELSQSSAAYATFILILLIMCPLGIGLLCYNLRRLNRPTQKVN